MNRVSILLEQEETVAVNPAALLVPDETVSEEPTERELVNGEHYILQAAAKDGTTTPLLVHNSAQIGNNFQAERKSGPIGENTVVGASVALQGALFTNVTVGDRTQIGPRARIGDIRKHTLDKNKHKSDLGRIVIEEDVVIGGSVRVYSPIPEDITRINAQAQIGERTQIGLSTGPAILAKAVEIGARALIAPRTIIRTGVVIGEGSEISEGYEISTNVKIPAGLRIKPGYRMPTSKQTKRGKQIIYKSWAKDLKGFYEEIE